MSIHTTFGSPEIRRKKIEGKKMKVKEKVKKGDNM